MELKGSEEEKSIRRKYKILAVKKCTKNSAISSIKIMGNIILGMIDLALFVVPIYMFYNDIVKDNIMNHSELYRLLEFLLLPPVMTLGGISWNLGGFSVDDDVSFPLGNVIERIHNNVADIKEYTIEAIEEIRESKTL